MLWYIDIFLSPHFQSLVMPLSWRRAWKGQSQKATCEHFRPCFEFLVHVWYNYDSFFFPLQHVLSNSLVGYSFLSIHPMLHAMNSKHSHRDNIIHDILLPPPHYMYAVASLPFESTVSLSMGCPFRLFHPTLLSNEFQTFTHR